MWKGLLVLGLIGLAFTYFVFNFVGEVEQDDGGAYASQELKGKAYYTEDILGDPLLNLQGLSMKSAREIWRASPMREEMLEKFPDFEEIKTYLGNRLAPSPFREYLLKKVDDIEGDYLGGAIGAESAKSRLESL